MFMKLYSIVSMILLTATAAAQSRPTTNMPSQIRIVVLQGQDAVNLIQDRAFVMPVVEIWDENDRPVESVEVTFTAPTVGPGATFTGQKAVLTTQTNAQGQVAATGYTPNLQPGAFRISVTARVGERTSKAVISQTNSLKETDVVRRGGSRKWIMWALIGGGGAAAVAVLTLGSGSDKTISVVPGGVTVGGLR